VSEHSPRLAPRSVAAGADFELLRVARTDFDEPESAARLTLPERIRGLAAFRSERPSDDVDGGIVQLSRLD
jgi:hypothetical protein